MARKFDIRDVSPFLSVVRNFLLGRQHNLAVRFAPEVATRSPCPPNLPEGPSHRLNTNYYYSRDARREVQPPIVIVSGQRQLPSAPGPGCPPAVEGARKLRTPGKVHQWD